MHEASLVRSLLKQVERLCEQYGGRAVEQIDVEIGPLSGVEPLLVREAFDMLAPDSSSRDAILKIHEVPLMACCRDCNAQFLMPSFHFVCPDCSSNSIHITKGEEFRLLDVTIRVDSADPLSSAIGDSEHDR